MRIGRWIITGKTMARAALAAAAAVAGVAGADELVKVVQDTQGSPALVAPVAPPADAIVRVEDYLNSIQTLKADFIQRAPDGVVTEGKVVIERPGKLRFEYEPGVPILVVADGSMLTFVDYDVKQVTRWPINDTPMRVLVAKTIDLRKTMNVVSGTQEGSLLRVTVQDPKQADQGFITLIFEDNPLVLRAWEVTDPQGYVTRLSLVNPEFNERISRASFTFKDPRPNTPARRAGPR